ncbi:hypothetical protein FC84_GL001381 [Lapidilactobacillus dextrinicus DSM 20335]|uniref:Uncharacterized protein n=1 Tax=Lapidilactobacillus dextrinicus DSM 20335 TaxID=1423738 RepID=A0A0R2BIZ7_9LACO|nr:hypothetical protein FC84_GL001381 [Lapidilactobacillus dextrinicus DSM 20335]
MCIVAIDLVLFSKLSHLSNNSSLIIKNHLIKKYQKKHPQTKTHNDHRTPPIKDPRFDDDNNASESYDEYADRNYDEYDDWGEY